MVDYEAKPLYRIWIGIKTRCYNPNNKDYARYGGRGITVCDRYINSYETFESDMGERPGKEYSVERIDNEKGYSPENCMWADKYTQSANRRLLSNDTSGYTGIDWMPSINKWRARISVRGDRTTIGYFEDKESAARAVSQARKESM